MSGRLKCVMVKTDSFSMARWNVCMVKIVSYSIVVRKVGFSMAGLCVAHASVSAWLDWVGPHKLVSVWLDRVMPIMLIAAWLGPLVSFSILALGCSPSLFYHG
jgi:hypothetical protein